MTGSKRTLITSLSALGALLVAYAGASGQLLRWIPGWDPSHTRFTLPNGWRLTPTGQEIKLPGDMPCAMVVSPNSDRVIISTCGFHDHSLNVVDLKTGTLDSTLKEKNLWMGLSKFADGRYYVSRGRVEDGKPAIGVYELHSNGLEVSGSVTLPPLSSRSRFVSGITSLPDGTFVALDIQNDRMYRLTQDGTKQAEVSTAYRPYAAVLSPDGATLAVSNWGDSSVTFHDTKSLVALKTFRVGSHPTAMLFGQDGRLFVTNSGGDTVSVITDTGVSESIRVGIAKFGIGSTPVSMVLSNKGMLYVALAGENAIAAVDVRKPGDSRLKGYIPTGRYPVLVNLNTDQSKLLVATGKGYYGPNNELSVPRTTRIDDGHQPYFYIGDQLDGHLAVLNVPSDNELTSLTEKVARNMPVDRSGRKSADEEALVKSWRDNIKHVIYIIRENRSYDQVLGDIPKGNGMPSLAIFGEKVTPNSHKLVNTFTLFDNLYTDGEVSQSGHQWTDAAYANDYCEKQWILNYGRHGQVDSDPRLTSSPGEYIWSLARNHGKTARVYGEYVDRQEDHNSANEELAKDVEKYGYSADFERLFAKGARDTELASSFLKELATAEDTGVWPNLMVMALPEDHTSGFSPERHTPVACVASNDQAIGMIVDKVSKSKFWANTAIFIIQDDSQNGPDHVDSRRTVGLVVSPWVKRGIVDSTMYTTSSMLRTMELMLGLPPMTVFDGLATPMYNAFSLTPNMEQFSLQPAQVDVNAINPKSGALAERSKKLDFSKVDLVDMDTMNRLLWDGYRPGVPYPTFAKQTRR